MPAKVLTSNEVKRVLAVIAAERHAERNRIIFQLSCLAGMRAIEISSVRIGDVYDESKQAKSQIRLGAEQTKGRSRRTVVISQKLQSELNRYAAHIDRSKSDAFLIRSQKSGRFSPNTLVQLLGQIYKKANVDGASSHSGRRTFITDLASKGVGARVLQHLAGHQSLATTQRYIDVNDKILLAAVELL